MLIVPARAAAPTDSLPSTETFPLFTIVPFVLAVLSVTKPFAFSAVIDIVPLLVAVPPVAYIPVASLAVPVIEAPLSIVKVLELNAPILLCPGVFTFIELPDLAVKVPVLYTPAPLVPVKVIVPLLIPSSSTSTAIPKLLSPPIFRVPSFVAIAFLPSAPAKLPAVIP